jgi:hypothetical protein
MPGVRSRTTTGTLRVGEVGAEAERRVVHAERLEHVVGEDVAKRRGRRRAGARSRRGARGP